MPSLQVLRSQIDASVNFIEEYPIGYTEARYVRRTEKYFICYLSSQTGCNRGCGFCHLTTTGQTQYQNVQRAGFFTQADEVFMHYSSLKHPAEVVHFNWMARGEPLANSSLLNFGDEILVGLGERASKYGLRSRFNISTIMPLTLKQSLIDVFKYTQPTIYYSLYSVNPAFREKWMPGAMDPKLAFEMLREYQLFTRKRLKLHWAFIEGENTGYGDIVSTAFAIRQSKLECDINVVRYNPPDDKSREPNEADLTTAVNTLRYCLPECDVKIIPRVGVDVYASCGMFTESV